MNLKIADTIIKRRRELDLTQEELATRLGISPQAVSNWERQIGYPDVCLIPPLANALGVSIDELFGTNTRSDEELLAELKNEYRSLSTPQRQKNCLLRYYHRYPNTYCILAWMIWIIYREYRTDTEMTDLAKKLGRRIISECTNTEYRTTAAKVMSFICGDNEAEEYINTFDDRVLVRPNILGRRFWDKQEYSKAHDYFDLEMVVIFQYIIGRGTYCEDSPKQGVKYNELLIDMLKTVGGGTVPEGWLGNYGLTLLRLAAAHFACGNTQEGYNSLEKALEMYDKWYSFNEAQRLSVGRLSLFNNISFSRTPENSQIYIGEDRYPHYGIWETNISEVLTADEGWSWFDSVRKEESFLSIINKAKEIEKHHGIQQSVSK